MRFCVVIPGRREAASPESITTSVASCAALCQVPGDLGYGFRPSRFALGRNDVGR